MGLAKFLWGGTKVTDADPLQVTTTAADPGNVALGTASDASGTNSIIGLLKKLTSFGQTTAAASMPVVLASGSTDVIAVTPVITAAAYSSGDVYGGVIAIPGFFRAGDLSAVLESLTIIDRSNHTGAAMTLHFFSATPASAVADNGAFSWGTGDGDLWLGFVDIAAGDYKTFGTRQLVTKPSVGIAVKGAATSLFAYAVLNGTPTYAVGDLTFNFGPLR